MNRFLSFTLWLCAASATIFAASMPLGIEAQLILSLLAIATMSVIRFARLKGVFRTVFLGLGTFVLLRYLFWRLGSTIPSVDAPADFIASLVLLAAEGYCALMMFLSIFTVADPLDRPRAAGIDVRAAPKVDVFVPSYNESTPILATTLAAAKRMAYPTAKLQVYLLDDGGTDANINSEDPEKAAAARARRSSLQALCRDLDVVYLTRSVNNHAKAGNLNNGLKHSSGDLIVVLDADHVPSHEFLMQTVGYFADEKVFLVQTPHYFLNPDPIEKNLSLQNMPAENEMFYGMVQKGLDKWNAAFFCGSAAVLKREALREVDGFHGSSITEDAETALELHARGWKSVYVDRPMVAGLQPETFEAFISQRSRWCRGMVQILLLKNPLFKRGLSVAQRLCYLSSTLFWLFPLPRLIFIFTPMCYIFFGMKIYIANQQEFIAYTSAHLAAAALIQSYLFGRFRWPWTSDIYEYIQSVQLIRPLLSVFVNPWHPKFDVTAKGQSLDDDRLSSLARPYFVIFAIVAVSFVVLAHRFVVEPDSRGLSTVIGFWTLLNLAMSGIALGAVCERRERRGLPRIESTFDATLVIDGRNHPAVITDMSFGGLRVRTSGPLPSDRPSGAWLLRMTVPGSSGEVLECTVAPYADDISAGPPELGLQFTGLQVDRYRLVAQVMFANTFLFYQKRSSRYRVIGILWASVLLVCWSFNQTWRGIYFALHKLRRSAVATPPSEPHAVPSIVAGPSIRHEVLPQGLRA